jgi:hypothetical protein
MASTDIVVDVREAAKGITFTVQYKNMVWVRVGMWLMYIGAWIGGFQLVDEFPMSLIQPERKEEA